MWTVDLLGRGKQRLCWHLGWKCIFSTFDVGCTPLLKRENVLSANAWSPLCLNDIVCMCDFGSLCGAEWHLSSNAHACKCAKLSSAWSPSPPPHLRSGSAQPRVRPETARLGEGVIGDRNGYFSHTASRCACLLLQGSNPPQRSAMLPSHFAPWEAYFALQDSRVSSTIFNENTICFQTMQ